MEALTEGISALLSYFWPIIGILVVLIIFFASFFIVHTQQAAIIERFGRFLRVANPGLNMKIPIIDRIAAKMDLRVQQIVVGVETKTKDNVFVRIPVAVQYQVLPGKAADAYYALTNAQRQIEAYVQDNVRTSLASMVLDQAFESKDSIANHVENTLSQRMGGYGWAIVNTLVTDIDPDARVKDSMNEINAAQRTRQAAIDFAEAEKIKQVKAAEGEAEAKRLQGVGIANERKAIVQGLAEQLSMLKQAGVQGSPETLLLLTQYFDAMRDISKTGRSSVLFMPSNPGGMGEYGQQITQALLSAEKLNETSFQ